VKYYDRRSIKSLILFGIRKNFLISESSLLLYQFTRRVIKRILLLSTSYKTLSNILLSKLRPYIYEVIGVISVGFYIIDELLIRFFAAIRYWREKMGV
jgi:hypothetical protein